MVFGTIVGKRMLKKVDIIKEKKIEDGQGTRDPKD